MLKEKGCRAESISGADAVNMTVFNQKLSNGEIDMNYLNQCLKPDSDFAVDLVNDELSQMNMTNLTNQTIGSGLLKT